MLGRILNKLGILQKLQENRLQKRIDTERVIEEQQVVKNFSNDKFIPLTSEEKQAVDNLWGKVKRLRSVSYREFEMFKQVYGFDARFLTHSHYLPVIAHLLNDYKYTKIFEDKGLLGYIKPSVMRFPKCYVRKIVDDYYDNEMHQLSLEQAIDLCAAQTELFIKPSHDTSGGKGAKLMNMVGLSRTEKQKMVKVELLSRNNDYVVQDCLHQHPVMAQFNKSSINTFRITTLMLNGTYSLCSIVLRCGKEGSKVDNWGSGGLLVSVAPNGNVDEVAYDIQLNKYKKNGNCVFGNCIIPQMQEILKKVEQAHREDFAICKFIGWDIAIAEDGEPVIIELNSSQPGVIGEQLVAGPIFGGRTQEVIDYCKSKDFIY